MSELSKTPRWKQAVDELLGEFAYGDLVTHAWMESRFGMPSIADTQRLTAEQFRERQFEWLANVESFKAALLKDHQICLQSVRGQGYRWVPPQEQTDVAVKEFESNARRMFRTAGHKLRNLRHLELTDDQRRVNVDAVAKVAALSGMANRALR
jgi:hypothetical protein